LSHSYTLSLHDALPISRIHARRVRLRPSHGGVSVGARSGLTSTPLRGPSGKMRLIGAVRAVMQPPQTCVIYFFGCTALAGLRRRSEEHTSELQSRGHLV